MKKISITKAILLSIVTIVVLLAFYTVGSAVAQVNGMGRTNTKLVVGIFVWLAVVSALAFQKIRKKTLRELGFKRVTRDDLKRIYYCIPVIVVPVVALVTGIQRDGPYIAASLFFTIAVGFAEEIYNRGYLFQIWKSRGTGKAIVISSVLFGLCHSANLMGGRGLYETLVQIVFAFTFGLIAALMYVISGSLWPCIAIHFWHNWLTYINCNDSEKQGIIIVVCQIVLMLGYIILLVRRYRKDKKEVKLQS